MGAGAGWGWGGDTSSCSMVILSASLASKLEAAIVRRQAGDLRDTESSFLDKEATGLFRGSKVWMSTPFANPFLYLHTGGKVCACPGWTEPAPPVWLFLRSKGHVHLIGLFSLILLIPGGLI